ncbi:universal stress protein [Mucilaginibacter sp. FT3.2]|uniref:universal stress protein n=1 Tax=Mucilaginibacter sp. FT3.2 TaxID=2723090 RepID=UPI00161C2C93|nr:universal stress protein [Mucilaginibacter sp. FT3.2]MBB6233689.1 nucleotide-binding universal stress UspA family protein [Mucilaginibacter sp. FT3.2]
MKTILVLTNFTIRAGAAARFALQLAIKSQANLVLCNVIEPNSRFFYDTGYITDTQRELKKDSLADLEETANRLKKMIPMGEAFTPQIDYIVPFGILTVIIEKIISERKVDIVVMATHRANVFTRFLSQRHIYKLIDNFSCPALLIPEGFPYQEICGIGYATDLTFDNTKTIDYLTKMAAPLHAAIAINYISPVGFPTTPSERENGFSLIFHQNQDHPLISYNNIKADNIRDGILNVSSSKTINVLALVHKHYSFVEGLFHRSISKQMAGCSRIPLLILPDSFCRNITDWENDLLNDYQYQSAMIVS